MKHILLTAGLQMKDTFSRKSRKLERHLIRKVFEELSATNSYYT